MELLIFLQIFIVVCMFIIGSLFGSFLSLATYRIPRHQDIVATRSYCPTCKHKLGFFDLIPVLSYIARGGKCKYCKEKISPRYFLLETINGIVFVGFYCIFGYTVKMAIISLIYVLIILAIGSYIMKGKMTEEEVNEVKKMVEAKKLSKKAGVFLSELVAALLLFITLMITAFALSRNSAELTKESMLKSNANFLAAQNAEFCLATEYDSLVSYALTENLDGVEYNVTTKVTKLSDVDYTKEDLVKKIEVKVNYNLNGKTEEVLINTLKGKVM